MSNVKTGVWIVQGKTSEITHQVRTVSKETEDQVVAFCGVRFSKERARWEDIVPTCSTCTRIRPTFRFVGPSC